MKTSSNNHPNSRILSLWDLTPEEFNDWRTKNDLPKLLSFFKTSLPLFSSWMKENNISDQEFINYGKIADFFLPQKDSYISLVQGPGSNDDRKYVILEHNKDDYRRLQLRIYKDEIFKIESQKAVTPYFLWLKRKQSGNPYFKVPQTRNNEYTTDFRFSMREAPDTILSRAFLFATRFNLLKLGGVTIHPSKLDGRNLDFVDLDNTTVTGKYGGPISTRIAYSACRNLIFRNANKSFLKFIKCDLENLVISQSKIQDFHFEKCSISGLKVQDSKIMLSGFNETFPGGLEITNCKATLCYFKNPPKKITSKALSSLYRIFRIYFMSQGNSRATSISYYQERYYGMISQLNFSSIDKLPRRGFPGGYLNFYRKYKAGQFTWTQMDDFRFLEILYFILLVIWPPHWFRIIVHYLKSVPSILDWIVWGFGEKPSRLFYIIILTLVGFSGRYYYDENSNIRGDWASSVSCAAENFVALSCEHKTPMDSYQGLAGILLLSLVVAGFTNRSRY